MSHKANDILADDAMDKETLFVSFSGGRTSGLMCHRLIQNWSHKYRLIFVFANTGCEHEKTYEFVDKCDKNMGLNLIWVEAVVNPEHGKGIRHKIVNFDTAARNGEPFEAFIKKHGIPNAAYNQCSERLKTFPMESYRRSLGFKGNHQTAIGIRADEPGRISDRAEELGLVYPLAHWEYTTLADVLHFWAKQDYDLGIPEHWGNCCLSPCWKKSKRKLLTIAKHNPEFFDFFHRMERLYSNVGGRDKERFFNRSHQTVSELLEEAKTFPDALEFREADIPPLQLGLLAGLPAEDRVAAILEMSELDEEEDCGSGCEIS